MQTTNLITPAAAHPVPHPIPVGEADNFPYNVTAAIGQLPGRSDRRDTADGGLLSGGGFAVIVVICLALGALALFA